MNSIKTQSIKPKNITIYQNENHFNVKEIIKNFDTDIPINIITSENNLKFHARFCIALLEKSEFICRFKNSNSSPYAR